MRWGALALLAGALVLAALAGIVAGGVPIPPGEVVRALLHPHEGGEAATIVWTLRVPRVAVGLVAGASLSLAGALMQSLLRNPLVDPYLTGISAGAGAAVAIAAVLGVAPGAIPPLGFASGLGTAIVVAVLARTGSGLNRERLILAGVSLSALLAAIVTAALMALSPELASQMLLSWLAGSLGGRGWNDLAIVAPEALAGALLGLLAVPALNVLRIGEQRAGGLGVDVQRLQWVLLVASTLLTSAAVTLSGIVGFVGLIGPHLARRVVGADLRAAVPASAIAGAILVVLADALARTIAAPAEIPLGVLLAFVGVPIFLALYLGGAARAYS